MAPQEKKPEDEIYHGFKDLEKGKRYTVEHISPERIEGILGQLDYLNQIPEEKRDPVQKKNIEFLNKLKTTYEKFNPNWKTQPEEQKKQLNGTIYVLLEQNTNELVAIWPDDKKLELGGDSTGTQISYSGLNPPPQIIKPAPAQPAKPAAKTENPEPAKVPAGGTLLSELQDAHSKLIAIKDLKYVNRHKPLDDLLFGDEKKPGSGVSADMYKLIQTISEKGYAPQDQIAKVTKGLEAAKELIKTYPGYKKDAKIDHRVFDAVDSVQIGINSAFAHNTLHLENVQRELGAIAGALNGGIAADKFSPERKASAASPAAPRNVAFNELRNVGDDISSIQQSIINDPPEKKTKTIREKFQDARQNIKDAIGKLLADKNTRKSDAKGAELDDKLIGDLNKLDEKLGDLSKDPNKLDEWIKQEAARAVDPSMPKGTGAAATTQPSAPHTPQLPPALGGRGGNTPPTTRKSH